MICNTRHLRPATRSTCTWCWLRTFCYSEEPIGLTGPRTLSVSISVKSPARVPAWQRRANDGRLFHVYKMPAEYPPGYPGSHKSLRLPRILMKGVTLLSTLYQKFTNSKNFMIFLMSLWLEEGKFEAGSRPPQSLHCVDPDSHPDGCFLLYSNLERTYVGSGVWGSTPRYQHSGWHNSSMTLRLPHLLAKNKNTYSADTRHFRSFSDPLSHGHSESKRMPRLN